MEICVLLPPGVFSSEKTTFKEMINPRDCMRAHELVNTGEP